MAEPRRVVAGVMGHVDHGKTALVRALTGMETDRLEEEKRRGISIALGFAHAVVGDVTLDLVDMPGHERFVRTMVSGATGVDAALLVVAANEGVKPQTVEHLDIAGLLGVRRLVVAVSKVDLASGAEAAAAGEAAAALARMAGLQVSAVVMTAALTGAGLPALAAALAACVPEGREEDGFPYMPVDRAFSVPGHGTVVTGTLRRGRLAVSDRLVLAPAGTALRVRGLQVHGAKATMALPGQRVAVNLRDVEPSAVKRGSALTVPGALAAEPWLTVSLRAVNGPVETGARLMLLFGTEEVEARVRLLDRDVLELGGTALAQLHCERPMAVPARERFILRRASPAATVAGGAVLDPAARRLRRHAATVMARWEGLAGAGAAMAVRAAVQAAGAGGVSLARLAQLGGVPEAHAAGLLQGMPVVLGRSRVAVPAEAFAAVLARVQAVLGQAEGEVPLARLAAAVPGTGLAVMEDAAAELVRRGVAVAAGGGVRLHRPEQERRQAARAQSAGAGLADVIRRAGLTPPDPATVAPNVEARRVLERLVREGVLVRTTDRVQKRDVLFHRDAVEAAKRVLAPRLAGEGLLVSEAGTALGISRKFSVPLLEHLDAVRFTRRVADRRVLAG